jgi:hypothetical protein
MLQELLLEASHRARAEITDHKDDIRHFCAWSSQKQLCKGSVPLLEPETASHGILPLLEPEMAPPSKVISGQKDNVWLSQGSFGEWHPRDHRRHAFSPTQ